MNEMDRRKMTYIGLDFSTQRVSVFIFIFILLDANNKCIY